VPQKKKTHLGYGIKIDRYKTAITLSRKEFHRY
jgi:hypothetical protein